MNKGYKILSEQERIARVSDVDLKSYLIGLATGLYRAKLLNKTEFELYIDTVNRSNL